MCIRDRNYTSIACFSPDANKTNASENISPYKLSIDNYIIPSPVSYTHLDVYKRQIYNFHNTIFVFNKSDF